MSHPDKMKKYFFPLVFIIAGILVSSFGGLKEKPQVYLKLYSVKNEQIMDGCIILKLNRMEEFMVEFAIAQRFRTYCMNKEGIIAIPEKCFSDTSFYSSADTLYAFFHSGKYPLSDVAINKTKDTLKIIVKD